MGTTAIRNIPGRARGIFPKLPNDFIILFGWHTITATPTEDAIQRLYQILVYGFHIQMYMGPRTIFGFANFINAAVDSCSRVTNKYIAALKHVTMQDMTRVHCMFSTPNNHVGVLDASDIQYTRR